MSAKLAHSAPDIPRMFFAESHASTSQECQRNAAECLRLLQTSLDSTNKAILLEMAKAWISFAEQQKAEVACLVHAAPFLGLRYWARSWAIAWQKTESPENEAAAALMRP